MQPTSEQFARLDEKTAGAIKNLGDKLTNIPGVSGAAILGDGRVGLILDAASLIEFAVKQGVS